MNISKTNKAGLMFVNMNGVLTKKNHYDNLLQEYEISNHEIKTYITCPYYLEKEKHKVFRFSKKTIDDSLNIHFESLHKNLDYIDLKCSKVVIMLDSDKNGVIEYVFIGSDIIFTHLVFIGLDVKIKCYGQYSLLTNEFSAKAPENANDLDFELPIKLLVYLSFGNISETKLTPKSIKKISSSSKIVNDTKTNIFFVDSLWKNRVSLDESFKVRGHFRLQPIGERRSSKKLIWISEFSKNGYNRKANCEINNFNIS